MKDMIQGSRTTSFQKSVAHSASDPYNFGNDVGVPGLYDSRLSAYSDLGRKKSLESTGGQEGHS